MRAGALRVPARPGGLFVLAFVLSTCGAGVAQTIPPGQQFPIASEPSVPVLVVDQERLFRESAFGERVSREIEARSRDLAAENRAIESNLMEEEKRLTEARDTLAPEEFHARAAAFDTKVQQVRAEQDAKSNALATFRDTERQRFSGLLGDILAGVARERDALVVLDRRVVLMSADSIDITADAITAIDAMVGDGTDATPALP